MTTPPDLSSLPSDKLLRLATKSEDESVLAGVFNARFKRQPSAWRKILLALLSNPHSPPRLWGQCFGQMSDPHTIFFMSEGRYKADVPIVEGLDAWCDNPTVGLFLMADMAAPWLTGKDLEQWSNAWDSLLYKRLYAGSDYYPSVEQLTDHRYRNTSMIPRVIGRTDASYALAVAVAMASLASENKLPHTRAIAIVMLTAKYGQPLPDKVASALMSKLIPRDRDMHPNRRRW